CAPCTRRSSLCNAARRYAGARRCRETEPGAGERLAARSPRPHCTLDSKAIERLQSMEKKMRLIGKVAVVTGDSMGIGEAIAKKFAEEGANVVLASREQARVEAARNRVGYFERTMAVACDVTQHAQIEQLLRSTLEYFGHVDIWVNNAGHGLLDSVAEMD